MADAVAGERAAPATNGTAAASRNGLTRDAVIAAAWDLAERGELGELSMRKLAQTLGVTAMALYVHVHDKDDILDELINRLLERASGPGGVAADHGSDWREWTIDAAVRLRAMLIEHPPLLDRYQRRPVGVPAALRRMEQAIDVYRRAGFTDAAAIDVFATVHTYTLGFCALEVARLAHRRTNTPRRGTNAIGEDSPGYWPLFFANLDPAEFPRLVELRPDLAQFAGEATFRRGLDAVLTGLEQRLHPTAA